MNIAEGCLYRSDREFARFAQIALGSAGEVEYQLLLAHDIGLLESAVHARLTDQVVQVKRMLTSLLKTLRPRSR